MWQPRGCERWSVYSLFLSRLRSSESKISRLYYHNINPESLADLSILDRFQVQQWLCPRKLRCYGNSPVIVTGAIDSLLLGVISLSTTPTAVFAYHRINPSPGPQQLSGQPHHSLCACLCRFPGYSLVSNFVNCFIQSSRCTSHLALHNAHLVNLGHRVCKFVWSYNLGWL